MSFEKCPLDLKNLISQFCFGQKWVETEKDLKMCAKIKHLGISPVFLRLQMWSKAYREFLPNILLFFEPIQNFTGSWQDLVDWHVVNELLWRMDFRRKACRLGGSRREWFRRFRENWLNIRLFDEFYRALLNGGSLHFKPTYANQRLQQLSSGSSPYYSARWLLWDYETYGRT